MLLFTVIIFKKTGKIEEKIKLNFGSRCPTSEDIKYRMTRVSIDAIDLYFQESGTATQIWMSPIRVSTCNLHGQQVKSGVTGLLPLILIRQFVSAAGHFANASNTNTTGSGRSYNNTSSKMSGLKKMFLFKLYKPFI